MRFRPYFHLVSASLQAHLAYPGPFWSKVVALALSYAAALTTTWAVLQTFPNLGGWTFPQIALLYGLGVLSYGLASIIFWEMRTVSSLVLRGSFDIVLIRPLNPLAYITARRIELTAIGHLIVGSVLVGWSLNANYVALDAHTWAKLVLFILSGFLIHAALHVISGACSFWLVLSKTLWNLQNDVREMSWYPLSMYPAFLQIGMASLYPLAFVNFLPAASLLGSEATGVFPGWLWLLSPVVALTTLGFAVWVWQLGLKRYEGGNG